MSKSCIITVTQGDFDYIKEWIDWHYNLGINLFLIGYNGQTNDMDKLPKYDYVKYIDFSHNNDNITDSLNSYKLDQFFSYEVTEEEVSNYLMPIQESILNILHKMVLSLYKDIKYTCIIDTDEFIEITDKSYNINDFLDNYFTEYKVAIKLQMKFFNDNDLIYKDNRLCNERFTNGKFLDNKGIGNYKIILNNEHEDIIKTNILSAHTCSFYDAEYILNNNDIYLKHFFTKTLEEWISKFNINYDKDYIKRFSGSIFRNFFDFNKMTEEKIKAIPNLLSKYNVNYNPLFEFDKNFVEQYKKIHNL